MPLRKKITHSTNTAHHYVAGKQCELIIKQNKQIDVVFFFSLFVFVFVLFQSGGKDLTTNKLNKHINMCMCVYVFVREKIAKGRYL